MFRKRLPIFVTAVIVALAAVTGYSYLNFSGPAESISKARTFIVQQQFARAITELDQVARGITMRNDHRLREEVWRLRYYANAKFGNAAGALDDVESLLREGHADEEALLLDQIRLHAVVGDGERASLLATAFLQQHPGHGRALELAGEACQKLYQPRVNDLQARIERDLSRTRLPLAREALLAYLYRPDADDEVRNSIATLASIYGAEPRLAVLWQPLLLELQRQRAAVQQGLRYFQQSLDAGGEPVAAFLGFAFALAQSGRIDDLLLLCESYRRRFTHDYIDEAGAVAAWALVAEDQYAAALATAQRWLPAGAVQERIERGTIGPALADLQLARTYAAWHLRDAAALAAASNDNHELGRVGKHSVIPLHLTGALLNQLGNDPKGVEVNLRIVIEVLLAATPSVDRPDLLSEFLPLHLELLQARNAPEVEIQALLAQWARRRPLDARPRRVLAEHQLERGKTAAALLTIADAEALDPDYNRIFDLRLATMRRHVLDSEQDGRALLAQCMRRGSPVPQVTDPIGYLLCAEAAVAQQVWPVAVDSARQAVEAMPQARRARLLEIAANRACGRLAEAQRLVLRLLQLLPPDQETLQLALHIHREREVSAKALLFDALRTCDPSPGLQAELLRSALDSAPNRAEPFATATALRTEAPELRILAARALALGGSANDCDAIFDGLAAGSAELPPGQRVELAEAFCAWLVTTAPQHDDAGHSATTCRRLAQLHLDLAGAAPHLFDAAGTLARTHPETAFALVTHALAIAEAESRNGATYELAGRLASRLGFLQLAEDHWTAALAFEDGQGVAEDLTRLCLAQGRSERAEQVYRFVDRPRDAALAARCGKFELAAQLAMVNLGRDRADLLAHCTLALLAQPARVDWQPVPALAQERLELVSMLSARELAPLATARAQALVDQDPASATNHMLLARALAAAGRAPEAAKVHSSLYARNVRGPVFWREIALLGAEQETADPTLVGAVMDACSHDDFLASMTTFVYGLRQMAAAFEAGGHASLAEGVRLALWRGAPRESKLSLADAERVAAKLPVRDAFPVLVAVLADPETKPRTPMLELAVKVAGEVVRTNPTPVPDVYATVAAWAASEGPFGCIVHFLLDHAAQFPSLQPEDAQRVELLLGHLRLVATGHDPATWLQKTLDRLRSALGAEATAAEIESLLQQHPTALPLWQARTAMLVHLQQARSGIRDLRSVLRHAHAPDANLALVILAGAERALVPDDLQLLLQLPPVLLASAEGQFALGLIYLRSGRPDEALPLLLAAPARPDGLHLYAIALAHLQSSLPDGAARARTALETLARDHASSSLARNAGSFSIQLAPR